MARGRRRTGSYLRSGKQPPHMCVGVGVATFVASHISIYPSLCHADGSLTVYATVPLSLVTRIARRSKLLRHSSCIFHTRFDLLSS